MMDTLLEIKNLHAQFKSDEGLALVLDGINLRVERGETLGLVGESGCGKSVTGLSILRLIPNPPGKITAGEILFNGENLLEKSPDEMRSIRGGQIAMIFQDPMTSLNPVYTIGDQIAEAVNLHHPEGVTTTWNKAVESLESVQIADPESRAKNYPHQFSGGMRQRGMIAMMLSCRPSLLIADEPTTALDVTVQAQVLKLISDLQKELGMSVILITHNLGVVAETCDRVAVMYAGNIVEVADVETLFANPKHPYTQGLLGSIPRADRDVDELAIIEGSVPNLVNPPQGCRFHPRCPHVMDVCRIEKPVDVEISDGHFVACFLYQK
jgi:oligopeptide/dipeptide ABC transporter ATP-binding protein